MISTIITTLIFCMKPNLKEVLRSAATREYRFITDVIEVLFFNYCKQGGIVIPVSEETKNNTGVY